MNKIDCLVIIANLLAIVITFVIFCIAESVKDSRERKIQEHKKQEELLEEILKRLEDR